MSGIYLSLVVIIVLNLVILSIPSPCYAGSKDISIRDEKFVDKNGREVILHGINMVCKDKSRNYIGNWDEIDFNKLREWGINCIRLGIIWDGLEPSPGFINEGYLKGIDRFIELSSCNNIFVILDMHQDLYTHKFGGDGAPEWAVLDGGNPHIHFGGIWSDAYFTSPAIKTAFDNFWNNTLISDGSGLQDHYALCWKSIAERYKDNPVVIGYDIMNEPFIGSDIDKVWEAMKTKFLEKTRLYNSLEELEKSWFDLNKRLEIMNELTDIEDYKEIMDSTEDIYKAFEGDKLMPFYRKVVSAIREVDKGTLLFLEPSVSANIGVYSGIEKIDDLQVYSPHAYDPLTDSPFMENSDYNRISAIFGRHKDTQNRLGIPMLIGEWGAFGRSKDVKEIALFIVKAMEELKCSETYWAYSGYRELEDSEYIDAIRRPYPVYTAGDLIYYRFDAERRSFICEWREETDSDTVIYLPGISKDIKLQPSYRFSTERVDQSDAEYVMIPSDFRNKRIEISL